MESLGDILKRRQAQKDTWAGNTDISSDTEAVEESAPSCPVCGGLGFVYKDVPPEHPDYGRAFPCQCQLRELEANRQARLERYSNLGPLTRLTFDNLMPRGKSSAPANQERFYRAYQAARAFAEDPRGWLVFTGASGGGKTHLAAAIANRCIARGQPALFLVVPDLLDHLRAAFNPASDISYDELFERVKGCPLLILDDLGTQSSTPWAQEKLYQLINHRYNARLPTVITTNLSLDESDERLRTRLTDPELLFQGQVYQVQVRTRPVLDHFSKLHEKMTFDNFDVKRPDLPLKQRQNLEEAFRMARRFAESPDGWLVFTGEHGCGKTHLAAAIVNYQRQRGNLVPFLDTAELLDHLRSSFGPDSRVSYDELFESVKQSPLLVLDDFGQQAASSWARDKLYQLINYRYNARLPTVITTSLSLDEIEDRISSRLLDPRLSMVWYIEAADYRADRRKAQPPSRGESRRRQPRE